MIKNKDINILDDMFNVLKEQGGTMGFQANIIACLVYKKNIITGTNSLKTHPLQARFAKHPEAIYIHAEIDAIRQAVRYKNNFNLEKATLYVLRIKRPSPKSKEWILGMAKPCLGCMRAIESFNIKKVVYSTDYDTFEEMVRT